MEAQRESGLMNNGGRPRKTGSDSDPVFSDEEPEDPLGDGGYYGPLNKPITLAEAGIDKHLGPL
jgi:hypothetical protein